MIYPTEGTRVFTDSPAAVFPSIIVGMAHLAISY